MGRFPTFNLVRFTMLAATRLHAVAPLASGAAGSGTTPAHRTSSDHLDIVDALYRFGAGQDLGDKELFRSAWSDSGAELDFVQPAQRLGVELPPFKGRDNITESIMGSVSSLTTTHTVTNPRVVVTGDHATLFAVVEAMHLPKGDHSRHLLLKNFYWCDLVREAGAWRIRKMRIENAWMDGDRHVLFPN